MGRVNEGLAPRVPGEVVVWPVRLAEVSPGVESVLSPPELERAARFRREADRRRYVAGRGAVRQILGEVLDVPPGQVPIDRGPNGRPEIPGPLDIGISHAGDLLVLALTRHGRVGIDVEALDPVLEAASLARRHLSAAEARTVADRSPGDRVEAFLRFWTLKEAVRKALGEGLGIDTRAWPMRIAPDGEAAFLDDRDRPQGDWRMRSFELGPEVVAAVALLVPDRGPLRLRVQSVGEPANVWGRRPAGTRVGPSAVARMNHPLRVR